MIIKAEGYNIYLSKALEKLSAFIARKKYSALYLLCDENTLSSCLSLAISGAPQLGKAEIIETESGEINKTLEVCAGIWQTLAETKADRQSLLINLGGGVICDMGGFCAALYKRGIDFVHIPTTLLCMADASIGGKTGVDLLNQKNIIGTFANPAAVFIEPAFLNTLPPRHLMSGFAEIVKIALVADKRLFSELAGSSNRSGDYFLQESIRLKNDIVCRDFRDNKIRQLLNFGHTIGHAIEGDALTRGRDILHGEAVAAGMVIETHLSYLYKLITKKDHDVVLSYLTETFLLPEADFSYETIQNYLANDKKNNKGKITCSLLTGIGKARVGVEVNTAAINRAIKFYESVTRSKD